jgi:hypothetical protein
MTREEWSLNTSANYGTFSCGWMPPAQELTWMCLASGCIPLKGEMKGFWSVTVRANWRIVFRFAENDAFDVDYLDYH